MLAATPLCVMPPVSPLAVHVSGSLRRLRFIMLVGFQFWAVIAPETYAATYSC